MSTDTANHHLEPGATLPLEPSLLLCPAHSTQTLARLLGTCLSPAELPESLGKSGRPQSQPRLHIWDILKHKPCRLRTWPPLFAIMDFPFPPNRDGGQGLWHVPHLLRWPYLKACILQGLLPEGRQAVSEGNRKRRREIR